MFERLKASFGKNGTQVDLVLQNHQFTPGDQVLGQIIIYGGSVEQYIQDIEVTLTMAIYSNGQKSNRAVQSVSLPVSFTIRSAERQEFPFQFVLPLDLPVSGNSVQFDFTTRLHLSGSVDSVDHDPIVIYPARELQLIFDAFSQLGLAETPQSRSCNGYVQVFEFVPVNAYQGQLRKIEWAAAIRPDGVQLRMEIEGHAYGVTRTEHREIYFQRGQLSNLTEIATQLRRVIEGSLATIEQSRSNNYGYTQGQQPFASSPGAGYGYQQPGAVPPPPNYGAGYGYDSGPVYGNSGSGWGSGHRHSNWGGAVGGFAAGMLGGIVLDEILSPHRPEIIEENVFNNTEIIDNNQFNDFGNNYVDNNNDIFDNSTNYDNSFDDNDNGNGDDWF